MRPIRLRRFLPIQNTVSRIVPAVIAALLLVSANLKADNWPSWRGPSNDGISQEKGIPTSWSETKNIAWKLTLPGMGGSTPAVWEDHIFLTCARGKDLVLMAINTEGKTLWDRKLGVGTKPVIRDDEGNEASPSPSTDGKYVYAMVGSGDFACFDFAGNEIWRCNIQERYGKYKSNHGIHTTPLLFEDRLYLALQHSNGHWLIALDKNTGKDVWKIERKTDAKFESQEAYSSPFIYHNGDDKQLVVVGGDYVTGHRLEDGGEIWRLGDVNAKTPYLKSFRIIASPVATPDLIVVSTTKNGGSPPGGPIYGIRPNAKGAMLANSPGVQWRVPTGSPDVSSPLVHDGLVYLCCENGVLVCLDAQTGKEVYKERLTDVRYRASPVFADGLIYLTDRNGTVSVVKAGRQFELVARNEIGDDISASPVISNGRLYLRGYKYLYAIGAAKNTSGP